MKLERIRKYTVELPFTQRVNQKLISKKEGAYLYFLNKEGEEIIGDLSPFPGFSTYSIDSIISEFNREWEKDKLESSQNPHLEFLKFQLTHFFEINDELEVPIKKNLLFKAENLSSPLIVDHLIQSNPVCLKIKAKTEKDIECIEKFVISSPKKGSILFLRIDSNGAWTAEEAIHFFKRIEKVIQKSPLVSLDYFEEPLNNQKEYSKLLVLDSSFPYFLEESLQEYLVSPESYAPLGFVVKPSQQGISVLNKIESKNHRITLSSAFESPIALKALNSLSKQYFNEFHGLTAKVNESDFIWS